MANQDMKQEILNRVDAASKISQSDSKKFDFSVDINGYKGDFSVKYPSLMDKMRIGTARSKLLGGLSSDVVDIITDNIAFMSATLMTICTKSPKWFNLDVLDDYEVLEAVYERYKAWADTFRVDNSPSRDAGDSRTSSDEETVEDYEDVQSSN